MWKQVPEVDILDLLHALKIFSCILIFTYLARKNFEQTIKTLFLCFMGYLLLSFVVNGGISNDEFNGRMSGVIYATELGQTAALTGVYIAYYSLLHNWNKLKIAAYYSLPLMVILFTQSRNSLAMIAIGIIGHSVAYYYKKGKKISRLLISLSILLVVSFFVFDFIIEDTEIGKRLSNTEEVRRSQEVNDLSTGTLFDTVVGDRLKYYVLGWTYFLESPFTGIGMWNFEYKSKGEYPLHTEYMIHLSEGGVIALFLWLIFITLLIKGVRNSYYPKEIKIIALFSIIEILFCGIYARVFYYEFFYPVIGIALALSSYGHPKTLMLDYEN